ncbi:hypothetical protein Arcve_0019 [Archaeoglobus veneficus SNP6]|uniref:Uncharacterized protein n=2 Tax=root TaxID=1 RepID=F2KMG4_ARCVS|nr:hypothetical protein Arcve_0019 [Archaeoglobus veneficus SNP6]
MSWGDMELVFLLAVSVMLGMLARDVVLAAIRKLSSRR